MPSNDQHKTPWRKEAYYDNDELVGYIIVDATGRNIATELAYGTDEDYVDRIIAAVNSVESLKAENERLKGEIEFLQRDVQSHAKVVAEVYLRGKERGQAACAAGPWQENAIQRPPYNVTILLRNEHGEIWVGKAGGFTWEMGSKAPTAWAPRHAASDTQNNIATLKAEIEASKAQTAFDSQVTRKMLDTEFRGDTPAQEEEAHP